MNSQVDDIGLNLNETEKFSKSKDKEKEEVITYVKDLLQAASSREAVAEERNQELIRTLGRLIIQMNQENLDLPFMGHVNATDDGMPEYYEVIGKCPNIGPVIEKLTRDCYKHVTELSDDVRTIFEDVLNFFDEDSALHRMTKFLFEKFENKYREILPKDVEEEFILKPVSQTQLEMQLAYANISQIKEIDTQLEELKDQVLRKCGKMDIEKKRQILLDIKKLSPDELISALLIVAKNDGLCFDGSTDSLVQLNEKDAILWELKFFLEDAVEDAMLEVK